LFGAKTPVAQGGEFARTLRLLYLNTKIDLFSRSKYPTTADVSSTYSENVLPLLVKLM
jgi:hypothetical protein